MNIGILGLGTIAQKMAKTINNITEINGYAVASRDIKKANDFKDKYGFKKAYGSYEDMLSDLEVQLIYIATPNSYHYNHIKMCLEAGKHVICEKPITVNAEQARELFLIAKNKNLLLTEAMWTRYMPSRKIISDIIKSGVIGDVSSMVANIGYNLTEIERIWEPNLAGGALLDIGIYTIHLARMVFDEKIKYIYSSTEKTEKDIDYIDNIIIHFESGKVASLHANISAILDLEASVFGTKGYIKIININNPEKIEVFDANRKLIHSYIPEKQITGFEYELLAAVKAIEENQVECELMPHNESLYVMEVVDELISKWGCNIGIKN